MRIGYKAQPGRNTQFRYDGLGRRTATLGNNGAANTETRHLWCGDSLCQSRTAADTVTVTRRYYPEGELRPQGNTLLYYHRDHLGSVRDVTNLPNAARIAAFDYGPYGTPAQTSGRLSTDFRYAGMFYLQEAGLYLTRHRAYDPDNARWLSRDPIGEGGGINLYGYVGGDPVNWVDPLGLTAQGTANGAAIGAGVVVVGSIVVDTVTGGLNVIATPAEIAAGAAIGGAIGDAVSNACANTAHDDNRKSLNDLIKDLTNRGKKPLSAEDADAAIDLANELGIPGVHDDRNKENHWVGGPHIHIPDTGIGNHIPADPHTEVPSDE